jgi:hypothetical protein
MLKSGKSLVGCWAYRFTEEEKDFSRWWRNRGKFRLFPLLSGEQERRIDMPEHDWIAG